MEDMGTPELQPPFTKFLMRCFRQYTLLDGKYDLNVSHPCFGKSYCVSKYRPCPTNVSTLLKFTPVSKVFELAYMLCWPELFGTISCNPSHIFLVRQVDTFKVKGSSHLFLSQVKMAGPHHAHICLNGRCRTRTETSSSLESSRYPGRNILTCRVHSVTILTSS